jgi:hypothetical protein
MKCIHSINNLARLRTQDKLASNPEVFDLTMLLQYGKDDVDVLVCKHIKTLKLNYTGDNEKYDWVACMANNQGYVAPIDERPDGRQLYDPTANFLEPLLIWLKGHLDEVRNANVVSLML